LPEGVFTDDDLEQDELSLDISDELNSGITTENSRFAAELEYVSNFIQELKHLSVADSKLETLNGELSEIFKTRSTVLIFTQYTDTMDYLRDQLQEVYGTEVACYSGRGGEIYNGIDWVLASKEMVKGDFKAGKIRILLCTESASEGLNLQSCGVLINYDMPWNPMRVEQRIGRIDRIGQQHKEVWISNYFYRDTIEDVIYQRLSDRIDWFEVVVGDLQPILAEVGEVTRRLAMLPTKDREAQLEVEITALKQRIQNRAMESLNLDEYAEAEVYQPSHASPVTLQQLEKLFTQSQQTAQLFSPHPEIKNAYILKWKGEAYSVTFSPACFDDHPDTVVFLSYGSPLLADLLAAIPQPDPSQPGNLVRLSTIGDANACAWFVEDGGRLRELGTLAELQGWLDHLQATVGEVSDAMAAEAEQQFLSQVKQLQERQAEAIRRRHIAHARAEREKARRLLLKAALVKIALGQQPDLLDTKGYPSAFSETAVRGLHHDGYPWGALLKLACNDGDVPCPQEEDDYYQQIKTSNRESLKGRLFQLTEEAKKMVKALTAIKTSQQGQSTGDWIEARTNFMQS
ncbi:MAG: helicase-related protein, partial [Chloroflexota bacterium]